ncbi:MarR family transcriptional regulator [Candidatus Bealeia paramacronuclearis]|uniref:MarR family transcriptional regulator n=1 Tax=Candidatus Bealeia paramacronuclearis TaxID=1921001 RepID=A0ABZ2C473_9PROT|nr:MarR family transcriptional regulator [Candidatus Bealeia paramacronuclearis]
MKEGYLDLISAIERLHRQFMEVVRIELDRMELHDINNVQCFILYNVGQDTMTVGEVANRGYYLGSNVSYNLKKLVENGYFIQEASFHDRRSSKIRLSEKGLALYKRMDEIYEEHSKNLVHNGFYDKNIEDTVKLLRRLESYWNFIISHDVRM